MVKLVALFRTPEDPLAFMQHYDEIHLPLVRKTPGLVKLEVNKVMAEALGGEPDYYLITEMCYPDRETFDRAMRSAENRAAAKDLMSFAKGMVTLLICEAAE